MLVHLRSAITVVAPDHRRFAFLPLMLVHLHSAIVSFAPRHHSRCSSPTSTPSGISFGHCHSSSATPPRSNSANVISEFRSNLLACTQFFLPLLIRITLWMGGVLSVYVLLLGLDTRSAIKGSLGVFRKRLKPLWFLALIYFHPSTYVVAFGIRRSQYCRSESLEQSLSSELRNLGTMPMVMHSDSSIKSLDPTTQMRIVLSSHVRSDDFILSRFARPKSPYMMILRDFVVVYPHPGDMNRHGDKLVSELAENEIDGYSLLWRCGEPPPKSLVLFVFESLPSPPRTVSVNPTVDNYIQVWQYAATNHRKPPFREELSYHTSSITERACLPFLFKRGDIHPIPKIGSTTSHVSMAKLTTFWTHEESKVCLKPFFDWSVSINIDHFLDVLSIYLEFVFLYAFYSRRLVSSAYRVTHHGMPDESFTNVFR